MLIFRKLLIIREKLFFKKPLTKHVLGLYFCAVEKHTVLATPYDKL